MSKKILVTGGTGCIGAECTKLFLSKGWNVVTCSRQQAPALSRSWIHETVDLGFSGVPSSLIKKHKPDYLLHLAWHMAPGNWQCGGGDELLHWVGISTELVREFYLAGGKKAVCVGSGTEYEWGSGVLHEASLRQPSSFYGQSKSSTGELLVSYAESMEYSLAWARLFFMYGGAENAKRLVPNVINNLLQNIPAQTSDGYQVRDYLYVEDVALALYKLVTSDVTGAVNVASGVPVTLRQIIETVGDVIGRPELLEIGAIPRAVGDTEKVVADVRKLGESGFVPQYSLVDGITATVEYWKAQLGNLVVD